MTEAKAIEIMKDWIKYEKGHKEKINKADELIEVQETIVKALEKKNKMIGEMLQEFTDCEFELKCSDCNCECEKDYDQLYTCNKQYFEKKAEGRE